MGETSYKGTRRERSCDGLLMGLCDDGPEFLAEEAFVGIRGDKCRRGKKREKQEMRHGCSRNARDGLGPEILLPGHAVQAKTG